MVLRRLHRILPAARPGSRLARLVLVVLVAVTVVAGGGCYVMYSSPLFDLRAVVVHGTGELSTGQVRAAAGTPIGHALADVDTAAVERRLLDRLPGIARAKAEKDWPHTLKLTVTERTPVAAVRQSGKLFEMDASGVPYLVVDAAPAGLPLVKLDPEEVPSLQYFGRKRLLRAAARVAADLPDALRPKTKTVAVRSYDSIDLNLADGRSVAWGSAENGQRKAAALTAVMAAAPGAGQYDVTAPAAPTAVG